MKKTELIVITVLFTVVLFFISGFHELHAQSGLSGGTGTAGPSPATMLYEQGREAMSLEDWYTAAEAFIECLRISPAHAEASTALAECYYELGEFDEALVWARKARGLARANMEIANFEAHILIALGQLDAAALVIADVLAREPYNREALFAAGELDIARGRSTEALARYREAVRRYPDDRRLLVSLALVLSSLGDADTALTYIDRALAQHPEDYRVFYFASYIHANSGSLPLAIRYAERALHFKPLHAPARSLLAQLRYRSGQYDEAIHLADESIAANRDDLSAWYLKGLSLVRLRRTTEAITVLSTAASIGPDDEFIRASLEDALISVVSLEDQRRVPWAAWHFTRAKDFRSRNMMEQALFEYRRGLRLNPYAVERREYADLLRLQGYPARYLEELRFLQEHGVGDTAMKDAVEAYSALLSNALFRQWQVNPLELVERHWKIAVFSIAGQSGFYHADAGLVASAYIRELLIHDRNIKPENLELRQSSFSQAFRQAREAGADYFMVVSVKESERDISIKCELFSGRTGVAAGTYYTYRTGLDRLRNASRGIVDQLAASLPCRGRLLLRKSSLGLIDKGKVDGIQTGMIFDIVKKGNFRVVATSPGIEYSANDIAGTLTIENVDEEVSSGTITRNGFFDRIEPGDELILKNETETKTAAELQINPELRSLLRTMRQGILVK